MGKDDKARKNGFRTIQVSMWGAGGTFLCFMTSFLKSPPGQVRLEGQNEMTSWQRSSPEF